MNDKKALIKLLEDIIELEEKYIEEFIPFFRPEVNNSGIDKEDAERINRMLDVLETDSTRHFNTDKNLLEELTK